MTGEPDFDELVGAEVSGSERARLQHAHELLVQAGPPAELPPTLQKVPSFEAPNSRVTRLQPKSTTRRVLVLLAAAVAVAAIFAAGYGIGNLGSNKNGLQLSLKGTALAPHANATLDVWQPQDGNVPMTISVVGLRPLPAHSYYDVYLVRDGKVQPWGLCGTFRVGDPSRRLTLTFNAPYQLENGDTWAVTRPGPGGKEPGKMVLRPVPA